MGIPEISKHKHQKANKIQISNSKFQKNTIWTFRCNLNFGNWVLFVFCLLEFDDLDVLLY